MAYTGPDMSGYLGEEGKKRWMSESGGSAGDYNRQVALWENKDNEDFQTQSFKGDYQDGTYGSQAKSHDWVGKRPPTPDELRAYSWDRGWGTDDYGDIDNATLQGWISQAWDVNKGGFFTNTGKRVDKPTDSYGSGGNAEWVAGFAPGQEFSNYTAAMGRAMAAGGGGAGGQGGQGGGGRPPQPTTFGNQLSTTGNTMQDMLINQFNTGQNSTYSQGNNLFGLGEDRRVGGEGINADDQSQNKAQSLAGGGLWWGQGDFNKGFDATKEVKAEGQKKQGGGGGKPNEATQGAPTIEPVAPATPANAAASASPQGQRPNVPDYKPGFANMMNGMNWRGNERRRNGMSDMMYDSYSGGNF